MFFLDFQLARKKITVSLFSSHCFKLIFSAFLLFLFSSKFFAIMIDDQFQSELKETDTKGKSSYWMAHIHKYNTRQFLCTPVPCIIGQLRGSNSLKLRGILQNEQRHSTIKESCRINKAHFSFPSKLAKWCKREQRSSSRKEIKEGERRTWW